MNVKIEQIVNKLYVKIDTVTNNMTVQILNENKVLNAKIEQLGIQGLSAYQIDVQNGFIGTEIEWSNRKTLLQNLPELP